MNDFFSVYGDTRTRTELCLPSNPQDEQQNQKKIRLNSPLFTLAKKIKAHSKIRGDGEKESKWVFFPTLVCCSVQTSPFDEEEERRKRLWGEREEERERERERGRERVSGRLSCARRKTRIHPFMSVWKKEKTSIVKARKWVAWLLCHKSLRGLKVGKKNRNPYCAANPLKRYCFNCTTSHEGKVSFKSILAKW